MDYCFYLSWQGLTPSEWAAWAQAILSGIGIILAAFMPGIYARKELRRKVDSYVSIVSDAGEIVNNCLRYMEANEGSTIWDEDNDFWTPVRKSLEAIPLHEVPDYRLYSIVRGASKAFDEAERSYKALSIGNIAVTPASIKYMRMQHDLMECAYEEAAAISNKLGGWNFRGRFRLWWWPIRNRLFKRQQPRHP